MKKVKVSCLSLNKQLSETCKKLEKITDSLLPQKSKDLIHETNKIRQEFCDHIQPLFGNPLSPQTKRILMALLMLSLACLAFILETMDTMSINFSGLAFDINLTGELSDLISILTLGCLVFFISTVVMI